MCHFKEYSIAKPSQIAHDVIVLTSKDRLDEIDSARQREDGRSWIRPGSKRIYDAGDTPLEELAEKLGLCTSSHAATPARTDIHENLLRDRPSFQYDENGALVRVTAYYYPSIESWFFNLLGEPEEQVAAPHKLVMQSQDPFVQDGSSI